MRRIRVALAGLACGAAGYAMASGRWPWPRLDVHTPGTLSIMPGAVVTPPAPPPVETLDTLRGGEPLGALFQRHRVTGLDLGRLDPSLAFDPRRLRAGLVFSFRRLHADSAPSEVRVRSAPDRLITFVRAADRWSAASETIPWEPRLTRVGGAIDNSLYEAIDQQVSDSQLAETDRIRLAWDLADVFAWQVDFTRDIQPGDRFELLFERLISPEGEVRLGRILASELWLGGKRLSAFRFDSGGRSAFYDAGGRSLRRAFLRAPVEFRRISSRFARARFHPMLGRWRRHEGTDYAAAPGTPVLAAGDGVVLRAGPAGGYGNLVELGHRRGITTRYGHLQRFARGVRAGARVIQGQVIGYVGSSGLATGPHLHYEFRVNQVARDPRRVDVGSGEPVAAALRPDFERERDRLLALFRPPADRLLAQQAN
jgi:murein DD-endopeptidase MepM/ murein hydrolase activator NlpD